MRRLALALALLVGWISAAGATSTINPTQPAAGTAYSSTPSRNNFQAAYNDINALQNCNKGASPPSAPNGGYCWINNSVATAWVYSLYNSTLATWTPIGQLNTVTGVWTPLGGDSPIQSAVANNAALSARASTAFPSGVTRLGFASAGDGTPIIAYFASSSACSLNSGAGDGGSQVPASDGKCWLGTIDPSREDIRIWGSAFSAADNQTAIDAAIAYQAANGGRVYVPGGPGFKDGAHHTGINPEGTCMQAHTGLHFLTDGIGGVGSGGYSSKNSRIVCTQNVDGITPPSAGRVNDVDLATLEIDGNAGLAPLTDTNQTIGIDNGFGTGWQVNYATVSNFVNGVRPASGDEAWSGLYINQQSSYPSVGNGYPMYGIKITYNGQIQGWNLSGGSISGMQIAHTFACPTSNPTCAAFTGDGVTTAFTADLSTLGNANTNYYLWRATGIIPTVNGVVQTLGTQFSLTDQTVGAPSGVIYGATPSTTLTQLSFNFSVSSAAGLPSSVTCSGSGAYGGCAPLIFMESTPNGISALPVGSYITSISGTSGTFDNPDHLSARVGVVEPVVFAEGNVAGTVSGCNLVRADNTTAPVTSVCGSKIQVNFVTPPPLGQPITITWSDPWGLAGISMKAGSASYNRIVGVNVGSYDVGIEDVSNGSNTLQVMYFQIMQRCMDIWTSGDDITIPDPNATVAGCPNPMGVISGTNKVHFISLVDTDTVAPGLLIGGDLSVNPYPVGINFNSITGLTQTFAGWWSSGTGMASSSRSPGVNSFSTLGMQSQRPMGSTSTAQICSGMTPLPDRIGALSGGLATLSMGLSPGLSWSAANDNVTILFATGTSAGANLNTEGTPGWLSGSWSGQQTDLNVTPQVVTAKRYTFTFPVPANAQEGAWDACWTPTGTAGANDYLRIGTVQLEPNFATPFAKYPASQERVAALSLYEQSYPDGTAPGSVVSNGAVNVLSSNSSPQPLSGSIAFLPKSCTNPILHMYSTAHANTMDDITLPGSIDQTVTISGASNKGFSWTTTAPVTITAGLSAQFQWSADCRP